MTCRRRSLWIFLSLYVSCCYAGPSIKWHDHGLRLNRNLIAMLVQSKLCSGESDCNKRELIFFRSISEGLEVSLYNINDQAILAKIGAIAAEFAIENRIPKIELRVMRFSKRIEMQRSGPFGEKFSQKFLIEGNYANY